MTDFSLIEQEAIYLLKNYELLHDASNVVANSIKEIAEKIVLSKDGTTEQQNLALDYRTKWTESALMFEDIKRVAAKMEVLYSIAIRDNSISENTMNRLKPVAEDGSLIFVVYKGKLHTKEDGLMDTIKARAAKSAIPTSALVDRIRSEWKRK